MPFLHPDLEAFVAEYKTPAKCSTQDVHTEIAPFEAALALAREQIAIERALLRRAEITMAHDADVRNKVNLVRGNLKAKQDRLEKLADALEGFTAAMHQHDRCMDEFCQVAAARAGLITEPPNPTLGL